MEKSISQAEQDKPSNSQDNKKYVDMTTQELKEAITEQEDFITLLNPSKYDIKEAEEQKHNIAVNKEGIAQEFQEYKRRIEGYKARIKEATKKLKEREQIIKEGQEFQDNQKAKLTVIKSIRDKLKINPNYYKNE